jgi:hypothetical protein
MVAAAAAAAVASGNSSSKNSTLVKVMVMIVNLRILMQVAVRTISRSQLRKLTSRLNILTMLVEARVRLLVEDKSFRAAT